MGYVSEYRHLNVGLWREISGLLNIVLVSD
jgi:hypothetical protein